MRAAINFNVSMPNFITFLKHCMQWRNTTFCHFLPFVSLFSIQSYQKTSVFLVRPSNEKRRAAVYSSWLPFPAICRHFGNVVVNATTDDVINVAQNCDLHQRNLSLVFHQIRITLCLRVMTCYISSSLISPSDALDKSPSHESKASVPRFSLLYTFCEQPSGD